MASQPTQETLSPRPPQSGRDRGSVRGHRPRRIWLAWTASTLVVSALAAWGYWAVRRERSDPETLWAQAQADLQGGRFERVEAAVARLARLREPTPRDWLLRAQLAVARNRTEEALADLAR